MGQIGFNTSIQTMAQRHWGTVRQEEAPTVYPLESTLYQPFSDSCSVEMVVPRDSSWVELNNFCTSPIVQLDSTSQYLIFSAKDTEPCNILIGSSTKNKTISVSSTQPQSSGMVNLWGCLCNGPCGSTLSELSKCVVNFTAFQPAKTIY